METIQCIECEGDISSQAKYCLRCGARNDIRDYKFLAKSLLVIVAIIFMAFLVSPEPPVNSFPPQPYSEASSWKLHNDYDELRDKAVYNFCNTSVNSVVVNRYSNKKSYAELCIINSPKYGKQVRIEVGKGIIRCEDWNQCKLDAKFDSEPVVHLPFEEDPNSLKDAIFLDFNQMMATLPRSKTLTIEVPLYGVGTKLILFNTSGFDENEFNLLVSDNGSGRIKAE